MCLLLLPYHTTTEMGGTKKRAGLFVIDSAGNTCCVIRSSPYGNYQTYAQEQITLKPVRKCDDESSWWNLRDQHDTRRCGERKQQNLRTTLDQQIALKPTPRWFEERRDDNKTVIWQSGHNDNETHPVASQSFLEMVQIPRGLKEKYDKDLLQTATREFCEETLCINSPLYINCEPVQLFWNDNGKRWSYNIFTAVVQTRFYFAFDPSEMCTSDFTVQGASGDYHTYRLHTSVISVSTYTGIKNRLVVMKVTDYIDYMKKCQLQHYGENNYFHLFERLELMRTNSFNETNDGEILKPNIGEAMKMLVQTKDNNQRRCDAHLREYYTVSPAMYRDIQNSDDVYMQRFDRSVFSSVNKNVLMKKRWGTFWTVLAARESC